MQWPRSDWRIHPERPWRTGSGESGAGAVESALKSYASFSQTRFNPVHAGRRAP